MAQYHDEFDAVLQIPNRVMQRAQTLRTENIPCDPQHEQIVEGLVKHGFRRHAGIGTPENHREGSLRRHGTGKQWQSRRHWAHRNHDRFASVAAEGSLLHAMNQLHQPVIALHQGIHRGLGIWNLSSGKRRIWVVTVDDIHENQASW